MYDGFWGVSLLILLVLAVIDLMSGEFARAATAGTILFIILCCAFHSEGKKKDATKERIEALVVCCWIFPDFLTASLFLWALSRCLYRLKGSSKRKGCTPAKCCWSIPCRGG